MDHSGRERGLAVPSTPDSSEPFDEPLRYDDVERDAAVGHGGTATVHAASVSGSPDRVVALKEPHVREPVPETVHGRFRREAEAWTRLDDHDHVVTVHGWATDPHPWIAMEYLDGGTLAALVGDVDPPRALWTGASVAAAVSAAHRNGVLHGDLTPTNVLLSTVGSDAWAVPKVADWGMARVERAGTVNLEGLSPRYAAPEQFDPDRYDPPGAATDVYQLGVVLYELLVGSVPFEGPPRVLGEAVLGERPPPATGRNPALPGPVDDLLDPALAKSPADRYGSMDAFRRAIERTFTSLTGHEPTGTVAGVTGADLRPADAPDTSVTTARTDTPYRRALDFAAEGFVELSKAYFARRDPAPPLEAWRRGVRLVDARAGRAVERTVPAEDGAGEDRGTLAEDLVARARSGTDTVVLGPPGSGKSTVCKRVACEWFDRGYGRVLYRESGAGPRFERPDAVARWLGRTDGHALVIVEDAVRPEARAVFEVLDSVRDAEGVMVLVDARESEWRETGRGTDTLGTDPVSRGRETLEPVYVPRPDRREHERFVAVTEAATDESLDVDVDRLRGAVERSTGEDFVEDDPRPGELFYLLHRLTSLACDPLSGDGASTLTDAVADVHGRLADAGDRALEVGYCVNLCNAAGIGVHPELLYAVVPDEPLAVEEAVDVLESRVLFPRTTDWSDGATAYPAVHEAWSQEFLAYGFEADGEDATERFGRVLEGVLSLGESERARRLVADALPGSATYLGRVEADPPGWLDRTMEATFGLAAAAPRLAPLFGTTETSTYDLPPSCPARCRLEAMVTRADAHRSVSEYEAARTEYNTVTRRARAADESVVEARALVGLGTVARLVNDFDAAREQYTTALEIAREVDEPRLEATVLNHLGMNETRRDEYETAKAYVEGSLELAREAGDRLAVARCLHTLGTVATRRGDPDRATDRLERSLEIKREVGDRPGVARSLNRLGTAAQKRGDHEAAREYFGRSLDIWQELGNRWWEAALLHNLGMVARVQGEYDRAERYHERALEMNRDLSVPHGVGMNLSKLGTIAEDRGAHEQAREYHRRSVEVFKELEKAQDLAYGYQYLGTTATALAEFETARTNLERSLQLHHEVGDDHGRAECLVGFGSLARRRTDLARARGFYEAAATVFRDIGDGRRELEALVKLIEAEQAAGRTDGVCDRCERVRGLLETATVPPDLRGSAESVCGRGDGDAGS